MDYTGLAGRPKAPIREEDNFNEVPLNWYLNNLTKESELTNSKRCLPLATVIGKLGGNIFSLPPVFGGNNADNLSSSDSS